MNDTRYDILKDADGKYRLHMQSNGFGSFHWEFPEHFQRTLSRLPQDTQNQIAQSLGSFVDRFLSAMVALLLTGTATAMAGMSEIEECIKGVVKQYTPDLPKRK